MAYTHLESVFQLTFIYTTDNLLLSREIMDSLSHARGIVWQEF